MNKNSFFLIILTLITLNTISLFSQKMPPTEEEPSIVEEESNTNDVITEEEQKGGETIEYREEEIGIQGNWRKKKDWLKQALEKNDAIQEVISDLQKFRKTFHDKFIIIDDLLDDFYRTAGFDKGELDTLFKDLTKEIKTTKEKTKNLFNQALSQQQLNELDESLQEEASKIKERFTSLYDIEEEFKKYTNNLEQLKLDMQSIVDLDRAVQERRVKIDEQINTIREETKKAQDLSKKIWHVIDDQKAKTIFYELNGINEKVKSFQQYIKNDLLKDFDAILTTIKDQTTKTTDSIQKLEDLGIIVSDRTARLEEARKKEQILLNEKFEAQEKQKTKIPKSKRSSDSTWFGLIVEGIVDLFISIKNFFVFLYELLFT